MIVKAGCIFKFPPRTELADSIFLLKRFDVRVFGWDVVCLKLGRGAFRPLMLSDGYIRHWGIPVYDFKTKIKELL